MPASCQIIALHALPSKASMYSAARGRASLLSERAARRSAHPMMEPMPDIAAVGDVASGWKSLETSLKRWSANRVPHETINATWLRLKPFINWSGARAGAEHGIQADQVSDTAVENFIHETHRPSKAQKYRMPEQRLRHPWNLAGETVEGWSEVKLTVAPPREWLRSPIQSCAGPVRMR
jgi:hypothetical protein